MIDEVMVLNDNKAPGQTMLWGRVMKGQKILKQATLPCDPAALSPALERMCHDFDIGRPIFLSKHEREMDQFGRTAFSRDHFMESIPFTRLEIELILPEEQRKKIRDPRIEA